MTEVYRRDGRLRLTIIGGFLGSGKSTWLRHQLHERSFGPVCLLVNEAAETSIDDLLLGGAEQVKVLAGGCACCEGRNALVAALLRICEKQDSTDGQRLSGVLLETSGLADPTAIAKTLLTDPVLTRRFVVDEVIVLMDAINGPLQLAQEYLGRRQIEAAERIIVTKIHGTPTDQVVRLVKTLRILNPAAEIEGAELGVPWQLPSDAAVRPYELPALPAFSEPIQSYRLDVSREAGWTGLSVWLSALLAARGDQIVRVKGVVESPAGRLLLQSVHRAVQPPEILPAVPANSDGAKLESNFIVLLGRGIDEKTLNRSWSKLVEAK
ncbi:CobW family GTP-binding protein [Sneathiella litorea]|uniref:GTP-binding protein n=1 Tax=Sneathiella litorea TaxID=2606216 RepID=A0A6L8WA65_9PROT|nr:GTP-binding protein [Sneathiella litorea]MZR31494.1 GTP-binding protein [Sneathiella litorea]